MNFAKRVTKNQAKLFATLSFPKALTFKISRFKGNNWCLYVKNEEFENKYILSDFECKVIHNGQLHLDTYHSFLWSEFLEKIFNHEYKTAYDNYILNKQKELRIKYLSEKNAIEAKYNEKINTFKAELELFSANIDLHYSPKDRKAMVEEYRRLIQNEENAKNEELKQLHLNYTTDKQILDELSNKSKYKERTL